MYTESVSQNVNPSIGATISFMYPGVWGYYPRRPMEATILDIIEDGDDYRIFIKPTELNLPRYIRAGEILGYVWQAPVHLPGALTDEHAARLTWFNAHGLPGLAVAGYAHQFAAVGVDCE